MYKQCDSDDTYISLHDCRAEKMIFDKGVLSFVFPDGFWVSGQHPQNESDHTVSTTSSQVDFQIIGQDIDGIELSVFRENPDGTVIREEWAPAKFMDAVNAGAFQIEFLMQYKGYHSFLFKCWVWFTEAPYHSECEIILNCENVAYLWNQLQYDCIW